MSAIGSVIIGVFLSPAGFLDAGDQATAGHVAEANSTDAKLPVDGSSPAAQPAAHANANPVARTQFLLAQRQLLVGFQRLQISCELNSFSGCGHQLSRKTGS